MLRRYPHTAKIVESSTIDQASGIPTASVTETTIVGRYEPAGQNKALDYSAKFYCELNAFTPFQVDGHSLIYNNRKFKIVQMHNYQTHCEIWLE